MARHRRALTVEGEGWNETMVGETSWTTKQPKSSGVADSRGSTIALIAGKNVRKHSDAFEERVPVWVFEEMVSVSLEMIV